MWGSLLLIVSSVVNFFRQNMQEVLNATIGSAVTAAFALCAFHWRYLIALQRFKDGNAGDRIIVQVNLLIKNTKGTTKGTTKRTTLILRNLRGATTVKHIAGGDPAFERMLTDGAKNAGLDDSRLRLSGKEGDHLIQTMVNHVIDANEQSPYELRNMLMVITCEDRALVLRSLIRIQLISEEELLNFLDKGFCKSMWVENPWQGVRIVTLHKLALAYEAERRNSPEDMKKPGNHRVNHFRNIQIAFRDDFTPLPGSAPVDWDSGYPAMALKLTGIGYWDDTPPIAPESATE